MQRGRSSKPYGAGSVFRSRGKWVAQWELPPIDGKRRRRQLTADTQAAAWRKMLAAQEASSSASPRQTGSVAALLARWLAEVVATKRRERTLVGYQAIVSAFVRVHGSTPAGDLERADVQSYLMGLDLRPRTIRHHAACLRTAFDWGRRQGLIERNPVTDLDLPAPDRVERIPLTADEMRAFLASTEEDEYHALWVTAAWTGMRQGELLALRWEDVSLDKGSLIVRHSLSRLPRLDTPRKGERRMRYVLTEPKTRKSRRTVPLPSVVVDVLRPMRKAYLANPPQEDQGLVFSTPLGSPLDGPAVTHRFWTALERAGVRRVRFHDLRHGYVSLMIEAGVDLATVSSLVGHSNIGTTVDMYGHLTHEHRVRAVEKLVERLA